MNPEPPFFSIITPAYNAGSFVGGAIESVLAQSHEDWEMVLVNDCSKDATGQIMEDYAKKDPRIRVIHNEQNLKIAPSLNRGCRAARGKWIVRLDADDFFNPNYLETIRLYAQRAASLDCFLSAWITVVDETNSKVLDVRLPSANTIRKMMKIENFLYHSATSFSKRLWEKVGGYTEKNRTIGEDADLWIKFFEVDARLVMIPHTLVNYRVHYTNITSVIDAQLREHEIARERKAVRQNREWRISLYLKQKELKRARNEIIDLSRTQHSVSLKNIQYFLLTFLPESFVYFFMWEFRPRVRAFFKLFRERTIRI